MKKMIIAGLTAVCVIASLTACGVNSYEKKETEKEEVKITDNAYEEPAENEDTVNEESALEETVTEDAAADNAAVTDKSALEIVEDNYASGDLFNTENSQYLELLSHLATTDDPFDFGENFTDDGEWIVDPADIDDNYDWKARLEAIGTTKKIGNDVVGYIEVPFMWYEYDPDAEDQTNLVRFSNMTREEVVTLTKVACNDGNVFDAYYTVFQNARQDPDCRITCTFRSEIEGKLCYRLDVYYESTSTYLSAYVTEGGDDFAYFLSVEFDDIKKSELARTYTLPNK